MPVVFVPVPLVGVLDGFSSVGPEAEHVVVASDLQELLVDPRLQQSEFLVRFDHDGCGITATRVSESEFLPERNAFVRAIQQKSTQDSAIVEAFVRSPIPLSPVMTGQPCRFLRDFGRISTGTFKV